MKLRNDSTLGEITYGNLLYVVVVTLAENTS
jgi:hypothetical protein